MQPRNSLIKPTFALAASTSMKIFKARETKLPHFFFFKKSRFSEANDGVHRGVFAVPGQFINLLFFRTGLISRVQVFYKPIQSSQQESLSFEIIFHLRQPRIIPFLTRCSCVNSRIQHQLSCEPHFPRCKPLKVSMNVQQITAKGHRFLLCSS